MLVIAHRGSSGLAPENTLAAFALAWQQGADGIEMDVHLSRDNEVMVHHDASTKRLAKIDLRIADSDCADLQAVDVGSWKSEQYAGEGIPTLKQVLASAPVGKRILIEIKCGAEIAPALTNVLNEPAQHDINLISFNLDALIECQRLLPHISCFLITDIDSKYFIKGHYTDALIDVVREQSFAGLDLDCRGFSTEFATKARQAGLRLLCWTVNDIALKSLLSECGLEGLTTDWPQHFLEQN